MPGERVTGRAFNHCVAATARHVAEALGNTPAVCRKSYINPVVFEAWREQVVARMVPHGAAGAVAAGELALALLRERERQARKRGGDGKATDKMRALQRVRACRQKNDPHLRGRPGDWRSCSA